MLKNLVALSNKYGSDENFVLAGGGNTSYKDNEFLYVKASGTSLKTITEEGFVKLSREKLDKVLENEYSTDSAKREEEVLKALGEAVVSGGRPSVEASLHGLLKFAYVCHLHPALVNGLTCSEGGKKEAEALFGNTFVWIENTEPGYTLAKKAEEAVNTYKAENGEDVKIIILENHGIFVGADTTEEIDAIYADIMAKLKSKVSVEPDFSAGEFDEEKAVALAPAVRMLLMEDKECIVTFCGCREALLASTKEGFKEIEKAYTPDHLVYMGAYSAFVPAEDDMEKQYAALEKSIADFKAKYSQNPTIVIVENLGVFAAAKTKKDADTAMLLFKDALKVRRYAKAFGGAKAMPADLIEFLRNWEVEKYRKSVSGAKSMGGKIVIVTGSAQGFGQGVAQEMAKDGNYVVIADMNEEAAKLNAEKLNEEIGAGTAIYAAVNVTNKESVKAMFNKTVLSYGGLDVLVNNAGIVRSGSLEEMTVETLEFVTSVNYTAYFICAKFASAVMKIQNKFKPEYYADIIQINSKSGLEGSNKNFAYAGSKFGGIGLTQSFALELAPFNIKVNSVCPGNFLDGPLWCDPVNGLFVQYLKAGKVPGAKTVEDVKKFYEAKVPMNRGCRVIDVVRAINYCIEQEYETGQAIPVSGGQIMLN